MICQSNSWLAFNKIWNEEQGPVLGRELHEFRPRLRSGENPKPMDDLPRAGRRKEGAVDRIDRLLEIRGFDQEIERDPGGSEGYHFHVDVRGRNSAEASRRHAGTVNEALSDKTHERDVFDLLESPVGLRFQGVEGLAPRLQVLMRQEQADAGLGGDHGFDVDAGLGQLTRDEGQDAGAGADA